jgi:hypothetical protein
MTLSNEHKIKRIQAKEKKRKEKIRGEFRKVN